MFVDGQIVHRCRRVFILVIALAVTGPVFATPSLGASDIGRFVGVWQFAADPSHTITVGPDGTFVMRTGNPPYVFFSSGRLIIRENRVTFQIEDWSPKQDISGRPVSKPASGTSTFEFPSKDTLSISGGIYYRR